MFPADKKAMEQLKTNSKNIGDRTRQAIVKIYYNRLSFLKKGLSYSNIGDYKTALKNYHEYLHILAAYHDIDEKELMPSILREEELSEVFLLSQVYWYMVKIYDRNPKTYDEFKKYLDKFILFSNGQKFQYVNSEVLRRYVTNGKTNNTKDFTDAYKIIKSKKGNCFIATYLYGEDHPVTENLRGLRGFLERSTIGKQMVRAYYRSSPILLVQVFKNPRLGPILTNMIRPFIYLIHFFWKLKR
ncbi:MAG: hypothetical protein DRQ88_00310 [Epsilonproteobacteria bacterium]|nr:MAG: hypothetical protein DRQ89_06235 [Campylobacterota bacterium]RLA68078.1 MAG: hypothetical protein DRQ88_00310 [Campylobacterota bacterium]